MIRNFLAWLQKNERHLGALVFTWGFVTDIIVFALLDVSIVKWIFVVHLSLAACLTLLGHWAHTRTGSKGPLLKAVPTISSLVTQYLIANVLSGVLIFYTKSSFILASWPFLILLAAVFFGNEYFRKYRDHLTFQSVLLFFGLYAYSIFALPLFVGRLGPDIFLLSTALSVVLFGLFLLLLWRTGKERFAQSFTRTITGSILITATMVVSYFAGLIPPIPLTLPEVGVYHSISRTADSYILTGEEKLPWWNIWQTETVHIAPGSSLYAFSAVSAPVAFSASVVHVWQYHDERTGVWRTESRVAFPIAGGRASGYRGYSEKQAVTPGRWRVSIETPSGQVIGRTEFYVVNGTPELKTYTK